MCFQVQVSNPSRTLPWRRATARVFRTVEAARAYIDAQRLSDARIVELAHPTNVHHEQRLHITVPTPQFGRPSVHPAPEPMQFPRFREWGPV